MTLAQTATVGNPPGRRGKLAGVDGFDAELYLRLAGERLLATGSPGAWGNPLIDAAKALLAVGAIELPAVTSICGDYGLALSLRGMGGPAGWVGHGSPAAPSSPKPPAGARIVGCERSIAQPWGVLTLHYAVLRADATLLKVSMTRDQIQAGKRGGRAISGPGAPGFSAWHPTTFALTDDRGTSATAAVANGGGSDLEWEATYTAQPGLAQDAAWIELLGERIACDTHPARGEVTVQALSGDLAHRFLWHQAARGTVRPGDTVDLTAVVAALEASGTLAPGDVDATAAVAVANALEGTAFRFVPGAGQAALGTSPGSLPEPWRSLLKARGRSGGPSGSIIVNVRTPLFDGISAGLMVLDSNDSGFSVDVELSGPVATYRPFAPAFDRQEVTWQASDDRGNYYLGGMGQWHSSDQDSSGTVQFWPALDPRATWLDVALSTVATRATVRVPLAWDHRR